MRGKAWQTELGWELPVRSWDESATQRRKSRRRENTYLDITKAKRYM